MKKLTKGTIFEIEKKTDYEKLPFEEGIYEVVHCGEFDGEKFWTGGYSTTVQAIRFSQSEKYTIDDKIYSFEREALNKLRTEGYLKVMKIRV